MKPRYIESASLLNTIILKIFSASNLLDLSSKNNNFTKIIDIIFKISVIKNMSRYIWSKLNNLQVGTFVEYYVKMEFAMYGFQVYTSEVDDRGLAFVARFNKSSFLSIQVKSLRKDTGYVFMTKNNFEPDPNLYLALGLLSEGNTPKLYLIPSTVWLEPNAVFVDRAYGEGYKSSPEWGVNISKKNMSLLEPYLFDEVIKSLIKE